MAFVLIQVGTNLWVNPVQVTAVTVEDTTVRVCVTSDAFCRVTDWKLERVKAALSSKAVSKAMEIK